MSEKPQYQVIGVVNTRPPYRSQLEPSVNRISSESLRASIKNRAPQFAFLEEIDEKLKNLGPEWEERLKKLEEEGKLAEWYAQAYKVVLMDGLSSDSLGELIKRSTQEQELVATKLQTVIRLVLEGVRSPDDQGVTYTIEILQKIFQRVDESLRDILVNQVRKPNLVWLIGIYYRNTNEALGQVNAYTKKFFPIREKVEKTLKREINQEEDELLKTLESLLVITRLRSVFFSSRRNKIERIKRWSRESKVDALEVVLKEVLRTTGMVHALNAIANELMTDVVTYFSQSTSSPNSVEPGLTSDEVNVDEQDLHESLMEVCEALATLRVKKGRLKGKVIGVASSVFINYLAEVFVALINRDLLAARLAVARRVERYEASYPSWSRAHQAFQPDIKILQAMQTPSLSDDVKQWQFRQERRAQLTSKEEAKFFENLVRETITFISPRQGLVSGRVVEVAKDYPPITKVLTRDERKRPVLLDVQKLVDGGRSKEEVMEEHGIEKVWLVKVEVHDQAGNLKVTKWYYPGNLRRSMERLSEVEADEDEVG